MFIHIVKWSIKSSSNLPYAAPECLRQHIHGDVYDHPRFPDGENVTTSAITKVDGPYVQTESGSTYVMGDPDPDYVDWCREQGHHIPTREEPIRVQA